MVSYACCFLLTVILELLWLAILFCVWKPPCGRVNLVLLIIGMNGISHPLAWLAFTTVSFPIDAEILWIVSIEFAVFLCEALLLRSVAGLTWRASILMSFALNLISMLAGSALLASLFL